MASEVTSGSSGAETVMENPPEACCAARSHFEALLTPTADTRAPNARNALMVQVVARAIESPPFVMAKPPSLPRHERSQESALSTMGSPSPRPAAFRAKRTLAV